MMKCNQRDCSQDATHIVHWPGEVPPPRSCEQHAKMALNLANAMGLAIFIETINNAPDRSAEG